MFRRTFWFTAGAAAGVWATTKVHTKIRQLTPESLAAQAANKAVDAGHRLREFALDVRAGMAQRESELGEALGLDAPGAPQLPAGRRLPAVEPPAGGPYPAHRHDQRHDRTDRSHPRTPHNRNEDH
ncbi:DUF6167 family protein [Streptomyces sp. NBC_01498]|uniref:DUF6167 family protein n=1 Tax=Streptomyces sp. NBC_01498 TaxID=2975870 RepID=UPI002E7ADABD|nr:DUF6167 family protein [Streptomyces sp. NBC_01498]WTL27850.1 DUF6167 family protein [Streptomyces sp. NBC_01498]